MKTGKPTAALASYSLVLAVSKMGDMFGNKLSLLQETFKMQLFLKKQSMQALVAENIEK